MRAVSPVMSPGQIHSSVATGAILTTPAVSNAWQTGTILDALTLAASRDGMVQMQIGARTIVAQTSIPLEAGQKLRLQVAETGRTVVLKTVAEPPRNNPVNAGIRLALPRQGPQTPVLASLLGLADRRAEVHRLSPRLERAVSRLFDALRPAQSLRYGDGLQKAVLDSGTFLESRLAQARPDNRHPAQPALQHDWKAALLRWREQLTQLQVRLAGTTMQHKPVTPPPPAGGAVRLTGGAAPAAAAAAPLPGAPGTAGPEHGTAARADTVPAASQPPLRHALPQAQPVLPRIDLPGDISTVVSELLTRTDAAIARIRLNQLASVTPEHGNRLVWLLELPVRHADGRAEVVTLRVERDEQGDGERTAAAAWTVNLAFDLQDKGSLWARVALHGGRVSASFRADRVRTRIAVERRLDALQTAMEKKNLAVGCLTCGSGAPSQPAAPSPSLLETRA